MAYRKVSIRRLFHDYCEIVKQAHPSACGVAGCDAPAAYSEYGTICLAGHVVDAQGAMPISRTADLAFAIVPAVRRDAGLTTDLREAQKRYASPDYASLSDLIRQIRARGWLWEGGHSQGPCEEGRRFWVRLWLPTFDPMHEDFADEREGYGATIEAAMQQAIEMLPTKG